MRINELGIDGRPIWGTVKAGLAIQNRSTVKDCLAVHSLAVFTHQSFGKDFVTTHFCDSVRKTWYSASTLIIRNGVDMSNTPSISVSSFSRLTELIHRTHAELAAQAIKSVNVSLTLRNWLIGSHITEFEQQGLDRAEYGTAPLKNLSISMKQLGVCNCNERELRRYR